MKFTSEYIDLDGAVYTFKQLDNLPRTKENAFQLGLGIFCRSWTFCRFTDAEKERCINAFHWAREQGIIKGSYKARLVIMHGIYHAFLSALDYTGIT